MGVDTYYENLTGLIDPNQQLKQGEEDEQDSIQPEEQEYINKQYFKQILDSERKDKIDE